MYKFPQEYLSVDPAGIILKNCCESLITEQGSFTLFVCIKIDPSGKGVFVPCSLKWLWFVMLLVLMSVSVLPSLCTYYNKIMYKLY